MTQISKNNIVKIKPEFIEKFNRTDLSASDTWRVVVVNVICNGFIAKLENTKTRERIDLSVNNLTINESNQ